MKRIYVYTLFLMSVFLTSCGQNQRENKTIIINTETEGVVTARGPKTITRNIIQDRKGNIWIAAFDGIFRYNGKSFINITSKLSLGRFFSVLEDRKGNFWFGSIGSGVYYYDGKSFQNFTTNEGLLNNEVTSIYEDNKGKIWFGVSGGMSCYDGKSFRNYILDDNVLNEDKTGKTFKNRQSDGVNSIVEDKKGQFWFGTNGKASIYNGKIFTVLTQNGKPFKNVRSIIEDRKGNIWLGGADGLWRYDGSTFKNFTKMFVGYIMEDKEGNIWTSSERYKSKAWALSCYDAKTLYNEKPMVTEIIHKPMIFGILEALDGNIWFGDFDGVHRYDGKTITDFKESNR